MLSDHVTAACFAQTVDTNVKTLAGFLELWKKCVGLIFTEILKFCNHYKDLLHELRDFTFYLSGNTRRQLFIIFDY